MDKIQEIKEFIKNNNVKTELISNEYEGWNKKLKFKCNCGDIFERTFGHFKGGQIMCQKCSGKRKITLKVISEYLKEINTLTELLDTIEPKNRNSKIRFKCGECGKEFLKSWSCIIKTSNPVCGDCANRIGGIKHRVGLERAKKVFKQEGYLVLDTEYVNNSTPMKVKCIKGHISSISYNNFLQGKRCKHCTHQRFSEERALKLDKVLDKLKESGFVYVSSDSPFKNAESYVEYKCPSNHHVKTKAKYIIRTKQPPCKECFIDSVSRENSKWWNEALSEEERASRRSKEESELFRKQVFKKDNFTCVKCGLKGGKLNAHHLNGYNWDIDNRANIDNGVTLCEECHKDFHSEFGFGNNTKEQFNDWLSKLKEI